MREMFAKKLWINLLCEFGPIASFLIVYQFSTFGKATIAMVIATCISFVILLKIEKHVPYFALLNTVSVILFGGVSALIDIPDIFIIRDTIFDLVLGIVLLTTVNFKRTGLQMLFSNVFLITQKGWKIFTFRWGIFYLILALTNEVIRNYANEQMWVEAKVWMILATVIFGMYQLTLTKRERLPEANSYGLQK